MVAAALVLAACSSGGRGVDVNTLLRDQRGGDAAVSDAPGGDSGAAASTTGGADTAAGRAASAAPATGVTSPTAARGGTSATIARGATPATGDLQIGFRYVTGGDVLIDSMGLKNVSSGDQQGYAQVMLDHVNATGGAGGHKLRVVWSPLKAQDSVTNAEGADQATCSTFTEDNHVFAALSPVYSTATLQRCLSAHHVPNVEDNYNYWNGDDQTIMPSYFVPAYPDQPRMMRFYVDSLAADGWFGAHPKIGIARSSSTSRDRAQAGLTKALAAHGFPVADVIGYSTPDQVSGGVLKFKAEGITHVFVIDGSGGLEALLWMTDAEQQQYRPLYAVNTQSGPAFLETNAPAAQLRGARGVGWISTVDVSGAPLSANDKQCLDLMHANGKATPDQTAMRFALATCDVFRFFVAAMNKAAAATPAGFIAAAEGLDRSFVPTGSLASQFGRGRHDGTSQARKLAFDDGCHCFRYASPPFDVG